MKPTPPEENFLEIPFESRYETLERISQLPKVLHKFRLSAARKRRDWVQAKRELRRQILPLKHSLICQKNEATGRTWSLEAAEEMAEMEYTCLQDEVDKLEYELWVIEAYVSSLEDMNGLLKGEQGRWNRETDGESL